MFDFVIIFTQLAMPLLYLSYYYFQVGVPKKIIILNGSVRPWGQHCWQRRCWRTQLKRGPRRRLSVNAANVSVSSLRSDSRTVVCVSLGFWCVWRSKKYFYAILYIYV